MIFYLSKCQMTFSPYVLLLIRIISLGFVLLIFLSQRHRLRMQVPPGFMRPIIYKPFERNRGGLGISERTRGTPSCLQSCISSFIKICKIRTIAFNSSNCWIVAQMLQNLIYVGFFFFLILAFPWLLQGITQHLTRKTLSLISSGRGSPRARR